MITVVVGGHSHNIGKTSVAAGIIAGLPEHDWTAFKITMLAPGEELRADPEGGRVPDGRNHIIVEEQDRFRDTDTSRFLAAGARRAFWVRVTARGLDAAMPDLLDLFNRSNPVLIESNSILRCLTPDFYVVVLRFDVADWKRSAREFLRRADAGVVLGGDPLNSAWQDVPPSALSHMPLFRSSPPDFSPPALLELIRSRLRARP